MAAALIFGGYLVFVAVLRARDLHLLRRYEAEGLVHGIEHARMRVQGWGLMLVLTVVAGVPLAALAALAALAGPGAPPAVVAVIGVGLVGLALRVTGALARRRPALLLPTPRWPDELRTLRTPAGRVALGLALIVTVTVTLANASGAGS
jgi:hypothetical protein